MKVHAPWIILAKYAEILNLKMPIKVTLIYRIFRAKKESAHAPEKERERAITLT